MIKINYYRYLSDAFDSIDAEPGKKIKEYFPQITEWEKHKILVNGNFEDENHVINDKDKIIIRSIPYEDFTPKDWFFTAMTGGIYAFVKAGKDAYEAAKAAKRAEEELEKLKNQTKDDITNLPYLRGASNSVATGKTQPFLVGKNLFTPYILNASKSGSYSKGYHTIDGNLGETQYLNRVYEMGFGPQVIDRMFMGNILLADFGQTEPKEDEYYFTNKAFAGKNSFCEIRHGNRFTHEEFNRKIVENEKNDILKFKDDADYQDLIYTLEPNSMAADVCIMFNGLMQYTATGAKGSRTRNIIPSYSFDYAELAKENREDEATWIPFTFQRAVWHEPTSTTRYGIYRCKVPVSQFVWSLEDIKEPSKEWLLDHIAEWEYERESHIKDDYTQITYTFKKGFHNEFYAYFEIVLTKTETTPGYYTDPVETTSFSGQYSQQIRFNAHIDFLFDEIFERYEDEEGNIKYGNRYSQPIAIKLSTPDNRLKEGSDVSDVYIQWLHSYTYDISRTKETGSFVSEKIIEDDALYFINSDGKRIPLSTLIGMKLEANPQNQDMKDSIQIVSSGVARVFEKDGNGNYRLSIEKKMTSNPAAWWWEVQTSDCHLPSKYSDDEMDIESFGKWFDYCEEKEFKVNFVITQGQTKSSILDMILNCGRGSTYTNIYGEVSVAWDDVKENASALLNEQNLISFTYEKELSRKIDGVVCEYIDAENNYQQNTITVMYDGRINPETRNPESSLKKITANGMTSWKEAYRYCLYVMKCDRFRKKKVSAKIGKEGLFFTPLSKFLVQHPSLKIGLGNAEIKNILVDNNDYIVGFELYDAITLSEDREFNVVIQCVSETYCTPRSYAIKNFNGRTKTIEFKNPFSLHGEIIPHAGDILSYGYEVETVTREMVATEISENERGFNISLVDYDARIVNDDFEFPEYEPILTEPQNDTPSVPSSLPSPTIADVAQVVKNAVDEIDLSFVESPNIYAELNSCGFAVNDASETPIAQKISTTVHIIQENKEIDFVFGDFDLPEGFSVDIKYHTVTFTVQKGLKISTGVINIPIFFRAILHDNFYADEEGTVYCDEDGNAYGIFDYAQKLTKYNLEFSYSGVKGGAYLGIFDDPSKISKTLVIGDYFTYNGNDSEKFLKGGTYAWDGFDWVKDSVSAHVAGPLSDVLGIANANLSKNNSDVFQFLDHLTANSIFVDKLVANTAYIDKLTANDAFVQKLDAKYLKASQIDANFIKSISGVFDTITVTNAKFINTKSDIMEIEEASIKNAVMSIASIDGFGYLGSITFSKPKGSQNIEIFTTNNIKEEVITTGDYGEKYKIEFWNSIGGQAFDGQITRRTGICPTLSIQPTVYKISPNKVESFYVNVTPVYGAMTRNIDDHGGIVGAIIAFDKTALKSEDSVTIMFFGGGENMRAGIG